MIARASVPVKRARSSRAKARLKPGAILCAYRMASIGMVPEPQKASCSGVLRRQLIICRRTAARVSRIGASPPAVRYPRRCRGIPERSRRMLASFESI